MQANPSGTLPHYAWYALVTDDSLEQGDFLFSCRVLEPEFVPASAPGTELDIQAVVREYDVLILSQSCDLVHGKLETVLVCPHWPIDDLDQPGVRTPKDREEIRRGNVPGLHMLGACELASRSSPIRVANFRQVFGLPLDYCEQEARRQSPRLRLLPPYREHLAQAFARFIMRVGLPVDIPAFR
jgi:hypothetical protein